MLKLLVALGLVAAATAACVDKSHCKPEWQKYCAATKWVRDDCPNVCKLCNGGGSGSCVDKSHCKPEWQRYCAATKWVRDDCPKLCGTCSGGGSGGSGGNKGQCGVSKVSQSRVVNGQEAQPGAWPWIVSLQTSSGFHFCGGSILTPNWILTASHCVDRNKDNPRYFNVVVGAHDKTRRESTQQRKIGKRVIMHPNYGQGGALNADVALIELESPIQLNDRVVKACMPQQGVYPQVGKNCYIAGWGATNHPSTGAPPKLQQAKLPVVGTPHSGCHNNREVVCVGLGFGQQPDGKQHPNACRGDSGGPLMCQQSNGSWTVEGVASYVYTYCKHYTAYAPVNKYLPWIKQYVRDL